MFVLGGPFDRGDGVLVKIRSNGPGAKVMGLTLEGKIAYLSLLQIQAGLTLQRSRYDEPHNGTMMRQQKEKSSVLPILTDILRLLILPSNRCPSLSRVHIPAVCLCSVWTSAQKTQQWAICPSEKRKPSVHPGSSIWE